MGSPGKKDQVGKRGLASSGITRSSGGGGCTSCTTMAGGPGGHRHSDTRTGNSRTSYCTLLTTASPEAAPTPEIWVLRFSERAQLGIIPIQPEKILSFWKKTQILELGGVSRVMAACRPSWGPAASPAAFPFPYSIKSTPVPVQAALILPKGSSRSGAIPAQFQLYLRLIQNRLDRFFF